MASLEEEEEEEEVRIPGFLATADARGSSGFHLFLSLFQLSSFLGFLVNSVCLCLGAWTGVRIARGASVSLEEIVGVWCTCFVLRLRQFCLSGSKVLWDVTRMCSSSRPEMVIQLEWQQFLL
jgi:hypothetical protein